MHHVGNPKTRLIWKLNFLESYIESLEFECKRDPEVSTYLGALSFIKGFSERLRKDIHGFKQEDTKPDVYLVLGS